MSENKKTEVSPVKRALVALQKMQRKLDTLEAERASSQGKIDKNEPIAVVGIGCRFPGGKNGTINSPAQFFENLSHHVDGIVEVPPDRWSIEKYYDPDSAGSSTGTSAPGKMSTRWGGFIENVGDFDPYYFGVSPREAPGIDPQHRLLLEVTYESLEDAGIPVDSLAGSQTGVFVGIMANDYTRFQMANTEKIDNYSATNSHYSFSSNRVSFHLNLRGPSVSVDTACSSSLTSIHLASQSLRDGECNIALAGGVNLILVPHFTIAYSKWGMMSPTGRCHTFHDAADGFVRGEGCGMVVLKRLSDAEAAGDNILAIIRGSAINQDGRTNVITAPNGLSQKAVIEKALENGGLAPEKVSYVECHGTGTSVGDPIEVEGISEVYGRPRENGESCYLGAVKTNIGHLEGAAGVAGFIKTVLCLQNKKITPNHYLSDFSPNPKLLEFMDGSCLEFANELVEWKSAGPRIAGLSSFGAGGSNAHMLIEEYTPADSPSGDADSTSETERAELFTISANGPETLIAYARKYLSWLKGRKNDEQYLLKDIVYSAGIRKAHYSNRLAVRANNESELFEYLEDYLNGDPNVNIAFTKSEFSEKPRLVFVCTGQGPQWYAMGRELLEGNEVFKSKVDEIDGLLSEYTDWSLLEELGRSESESRIQDTEVAQPAIFALQVALAEVWKHWGIKPDAVVGHSVGEVAASHIAGVLSLEDAVKVIYHRGRLMQQATGLGKMAAVEISVDKVSKYLKGYEDKLAIAAQNGPTSITLSGEEAALNAVLTALQKDEIFTRMLKVNYAFHSPQMEPFKDELVKSLAGLEPKRPRIAIFSSVRGAKAQEGDYNAEYWGQNVRQGVYFANSISTLLTGGDSGDDTTKIKHNVFLEIGPHPALGGYIKQCIAAEGAKSAKAMAPLPSLKRKEDERAVMLNSLGWLYARGFKVKLENVIDKGNFISTPTYPWQRERYWVDISLDEQRSSVIEGAIVESEPSSETEVSADNWYYNISWLDKINQNEALAGDSAPCLIFADQAGVASKLVESFEADGRRVVSVVRGDSFEVLDGDQYQVNPGNVEDLSRLLAEAFPAEREIPGKIVYLWGEDAPFSEDLTPSELLDTQKSNLNALHNLLKAVYDSDWDDKPRLFIITRNAVFIDGDESVEGMAGSTLWGLGRTIAVEHPEFWGGLFDLSRNHSVDESALLIKNALVNPDGEDQIAFRDSKRFVARMTRIDKEKIPESSPVVKEDAAYLITGGFGGLGLVMANWMADQGARHIVLMGRTPLPPREEWDGEHPERIADRIKSILELEAKGAKVYPVYIDIAKEEDFTAALQKLKEENCPVIRGVFHCIVVLNVGTLLQLNNKELEDSILSKIVGSWLIHRHLGENELDFYILFSSGASMLGVLAEGMGGYAASNTFLDSLGHYRRSRGQSAISLNWGNWNEEGTGSTEMGKKMLANLARRGIGSFPSRVGLGIMGNLLNHEYPQVAILPVNWELLGQSYPYMSRSPFTADLVREDKLAKHKDKPDEESEAGITLDTLILAETEERGRLMIAYFSNLVSEILQIPLKRLQTDNSLKDQGLDSISAIEMRNRVETELTLNLPTAKLLDGSNIEQISSHFVSKLENEQPSLPQGEGVINFPLMEGQQSIWFQEILSPNNIASNIHYAIQINESIEVSRIEEVLKVLQERYSALRSTLLLKSGEVSQLIHPKQELDFVGGDASIWTSEELSSLLTEEVHIPFDLFAGPLVRFRLYSLSGSEHIFLITAHKVALDTKSLCILMDKIWDLYHDESPLDSNIAPEPEGDIVAAQEWQNNLLTSGEGEKLKDFWKNQLPEVIPFLNLPTDFNHSSKWDFYGAVQSAEITGEKLGELNLDLNGDSYELFINFLVTYQLVLYNYTGSENIYVGSERRAVQGSEFENGLGSFSHPVVFFADIEPGETIAGFREKIKERVRLALEHQNYPFTQIISDVQPLRHAGRNPIVQCFFSFASEMGWPIYDTAEYDIKLSAGNVSAIKIEEDLSPYDLYLKIIKNSEGFGLDVNYKSSIFKKTTIERFIESYLKLLSVVIKEPERAIRNLSFFREDEIHPVVFEEEKEIQRYNSIGKLFEAKVSLVPGLTAVVEGDRKITFSVLNILANKIAHYLKSENVGAGPDVTVGVLMDRSIEMIASFLGVLKSGSAYIPLPYDLPPEKARKILSDSNVGIIIITKQDEFSSEVLEGFKGLTIELDEVNAELRKYPDDNPDYVIEQDNLACILYTELSDENPVGVDITHRYIINDVLWQIRNSSLDYGARTAQFHSTLSYASLSEIFSTLCSSGVLILEKEEVIGDANLFCKALIEKRVERAFLPEVMLTALGEIADHQDIVPHYLRELYAVGERVYISQDVALLLSKLRGCSFIYLYGIPETGIVTSYKLSDVNVSWPAVLPLGEGIDNTEVMLLDTNMNPVPEGVVGELYIRSSCLARGYHQNPHLTVQKFVSSPFDRNGERIFRTSMIAKKTSPTEIKIIGFMDNQISIRDTKMNFEEIEVALTQHPAVLQATVLKSDTIGGNNLLAYIVSNRIVDRMLMLVRCRVEYDDGKTVSLVSDDISPTGLSLGGIPESWQKDQDVKINLLLPGVSSEISLEANIARIQGNRAGVLFKSSPINQSLLKMSLSQIIELETLNLTQNSASEFRIPLRRSCTLESGDGKVYNLVSEHLSSKEIGIGNVPEELKTNKNVRISISLPGLSSDVRIKGNLSWRHGNMTGFLLDPDEETKVQLTQFFMHYTKNQLLSVNHLKSFMKTKLPHFLIPQRFIILEKLPVLPDGQIDIKNLPYFEGSFFSEMDESFVGPRTPVEGLLAGIWTDVLLIEQISIYDNFFDIGGTSLQAVDVQNKIKEEFQVEISLNHILVNPTVADIAATIVQKKTEADEKEAMAKAMEELELLSQEDLASLLE